MGLGTAGSRCLNSATRNLFPSLTLLSFVVDPFSGRLSPVMAEGATSSCTCSNLSRKGWPFPDNPNKSSRVGLNALTGPSVNLGIRHCGQREGISSLARLKSQAGPGRGRGETTNHVVSEGRLGHCYEKQEV